MSLSSLPQTSQQTMTAAMLYAPGDVRIETMALPAPGPGELILRVEVALTCGTDLKTYRRGHPVLIPTFPSGFGHECAGTVFRLGEGISAFSPGDRVVVANSAPCFACFYCHKGALNLCEHLAFLNGAYAQYLRVPERIVRNNTHRLADHVSFVQAAFTEPLAVSLRGIAACRIQPGDTVCVLGLGAIGQLMVKLATLHGAHVTAVGHNAMKRTLAETFGGASRVVDRATLPEPRAIRDRFSPGGHGFDVVIEAVGQPETWELAIDLARRGGRVCLFGGCAAGSRITVDTRRLHYDEITLVSPFHHTPTDVAEALAMITRGDLDPTPLVTRTMPLAQVVAALEAVASGTALKVAFFPHEPGL